MAQLTKKSVNAQKQAIKQEFLSFNSCAAAVLNVAPNEDVAPYYTAAGVPAKDESNTAKVAYMRAHVLPMLPQTSAGAPVVFTTNKARALNWLENESPVFINCGELHREYGNASGEFGSLRPVYFYRERVVFSSVVLKDNGAAGKVYKVENGARVKETRTVREYVAARTAYTLTSKDGTGLIDLFFTFLGIPAALAEQAAAKAAEKAAKAVVAAEQAAVKAAATAKDAQTKADEMKARAKDKRKAAAAVASEKGLTSEQAAEIIAKAAPEQAAEQAEQAEQAAAAVSENVRKKTNTKTRANNIVTK